MAADDAARFLQSLIDSEGIKYVELNPHRDITGAYDGRVDAYGRYIGLVYGGGKCFNAALVEMGHGEVYLHDDGAYHVPEMALKDYYSYTGPSSPSIAASSAVVSQLDFNGALFELIAMAAYLAGGYTWHVDPAGAVLFTPPDTVDRVLTHDPVRQGIALGSRSLSVTNVIAFQGHPVFSTLLKTYARQASVDELGARTRVLRAFAMVQEADADQLVEALLDDVAYPTPSGDVVWYHGDASVRVGDCIEVRGAPFRQLERRIPGAWRELFGGKLVGRIHEVTHRFMGGRVQTRARLTSPLRSVSDPLRFMILSQPSETSLFQFRLDDSDVGLDLGYRLD